MSSSAVHLGESSPATVLAGTIASSGERAEIEVVRQLLLAFSNALSRPDPKFRRRQLPAVVVRNLSDASPRQLSVLEFIGSGLFYAATARLIRNAVPFPLNTRFCITAVRSFLGSEHGVGVVLQQLSSPDTSIKTFYIVLGVLKGISREVAVAWLGAVLREALTALSKEGELLLSTQPELALFDQATPSDPVGKLISKVMEMRLVFGLERLPRQVTPPSTRNIKPMPRRSIAQPVQDETNL
ncbi:hypothetical protein B0H11DRAFT_2184998 [Mycena galericulata]|nr:hypothetical protein B0H11DRAFT_2184998 [Mycena galericulata]